MRRCLLPLISLVLFSSVSATQAQQSQPSPPGLSFEFYRAHVEPIFLARRAGHARCYACHALGAGEGNAPAAMRLEILSPGSTTWTEEQSRKNFDAVRKKVFANNPFSSPLLIHPLRYEAGGDQWHGGGAQFTSPNDPEWQTIAAWVQGKNVVDEDLRGSSIPAAPANAVRAAASNNGGLKLRIIQTNMAGDNIHIIDPVMNRVVAEITGIEANHGVAAGPDGSRLYVSNEADRTVDVVDMKTLRVCKQIPLSGRPNNISISKDG